MNFDQALSATETSLNSAGSAQQEFETALDSIEKRLEGLAGSFTQLVTDGLLTDFIKLILTATQGILDFANSGLGQFIIQMGLAIGAMATFNVLIKTTIATKIISFFSFLTTGITTVGVATRATNIALIAMNGILNVIKAHPVIAALTAFTVLMTGLFAIADALNVTLEENQEKLAELKAEYNSIQSAVESAGTSLEGIRDKIEEIQALGTINPLEQKELEDLEAEEERLERILALKKEEAKFAQEELEKQFEQTLYSEVDNKYGDTTKRNSRGRIIDVYEQTDRVEALKDASAEMEKQIDIISELNKTEEENGNLTEEQEKARESANEAYKEASKSVNQYALDLEVESKGLDESSETRAYALEGIDAYTDALISYSELTREVVEANEDYAVSLRYSSEQIQNQIDKVEALTEANNDAKDSVVDMESEFSTLSSVIADYNSNNGWTIDTINTLLEMDTEYLSLLTEAEGVLTLNKEASIALAKAKIEEQKAVAVANIAALSSLNIMQELNGESGDGYAEQIDDLVAQIKLYDLLLENVEQYVKGNEAVNDVVKTRLELLEEEKQSIEESLDEYDTVINHIVDGYNEQIDIVEEEKEATLDAISAKIDAINEEQDAFKASQELKITALEEERDLRIAQNDELIESLDEAKTAQSEYWDTLIDKIQGENDALNENIELERLRENIAKAQSTKVNIFQDGKFTYGTDEEAVSDAVSELSTYERELALQAQIDNLTAMKEQALANIDAQTTAIENSSTIISEQYDLQIQLIQSYISEKEVQSQKEIDDLNKLYAEKESLYDNDISNLNNYVTYFEDILNLHKNAEAEILYQQYLGEVENYNMRDEAFANFINNYQAKLQQLQSISGQIVTETSGISITTPTVDMPTISSTPITPSTATNYDDIFSSTVGSTSTSGTTTDTNMSTTTTISSTASTTTPSYSTSGSVSTVSPTMTYSEGVFSSSNVGAEYVTEGIGILPGTEPQTSSAGGTVLQAPPLGGTLGASGNRYYYDPADYAEWVAYANKLPWEQEYGNLTEEEWFKLKYGSSTYSPITQQQQQMEQDYLDFFSNLGLEPPKFATGVAEVKDDQIAITGDPPNVEAIIGSKYNKSMGIPTVLHKGAGVLNADATKTFAGMMNSILGSSSPTLANNNSGVTQSFSIQNLNLQGVQDPDGLATALANKFKTYVAQKT